MSLRMNSNLTKGAFNRITKSTGADKGILKHVSDTLSSGTFKELDLSILEDFPKHKFKLYTDEELQALADSIKMVGLLDPILVWQEKSGNYYILCGHNRVRACKLAGLKTVTCNVKDYENIEVAKLAVIASNLERRGGFECLSFEEKVSVIKEEFDTLKKLYDEDKEKYGKAAVLGFDAKKEVGVHYNLSSTQANTYYQIGKVFKKEWIELIPKHFNVKTAFSLAHLNKENLTAIMNEIIEARDSEENKIIKIGDSQAKEIRKMQNEGVDIDVIVTSLYKTKKKDDKKKYSIDFNSEEFSPYYKNFMKTDPTIIKDIFLKALDNYFKNK